MTWLSKNAASESYGINLKSVYNNQWESSLFFNASNYNYGQIGFDYNDEDINETIVKFGIESANEI